MDMSNNEEYDSREEYRPCPICQKIVHVDNEKHNLYDCRNFILKKFYTEEDPEKRLKLEKQIDKINAKLGTKSKNLVDT